MASVIEVLVGRLDFPIGVRDIASFAETSPGTVSKVLPVLEDADVVRRTPLGTVSSVDRRGLVDYWSASYNVLTSNHAVGLYSPRGPDHILRVIRGHIRVDSERLTAAVAARSWLDTTPPITPLTQVMMYTTRPAYWLKTVSAEPVAPSRSNLILLPARSRLPLEASVEALSDMPLLGDDESTWGPVTTTARTLVDLMTSGGRGDAEADHLFSSLSNGRWNR